MNATTTHRIVTLLLLVLMSLLFTACASGPRTRMSDNDFRKLIDEYNQELPLADQIRCRKVRPIGSNIPLWECSSKWNEDSEAIRQEDLLRWMRSRPNTRKGN